MPEEPEANDSTDRSSRNQPSTDRSSRDQPTAGPGKRPGTGEPASGRSSGAQPRGSTGSSPSAPPAPPRPGMSDRTPAPIAQTIPPTGTIQAARALWRTSFLVGLVTLVLIFLSRDSQLERLQQIVTELEPDQTAETLEAVAATAFWGSAGALALILLIEALLVRRMMRRRGGVRWALLILVLAHCGAAALANALLIDSGDDGLYLRLFLLAQLLLAGAALIISLTPGANSWFRGQGQPHRGPAR